ncbi:MAG: GNAT family protein [Bacteroidota bacterium]
MRAFDYHQPQILEDEVVRLRPLHASHIGLLTEAASHRGVWTYFLEHGCGQPYLTQYVHAALARRRAGQAYPFVVEDKASGRLAGMTQLYEIQPWLGVLKVGHTWLGTEFQGTGLNTRAKYLLFALVFDTLEAERIGFGVHADNVQSLRALARVGVQQEGVLRAYLPRDHGAGRADLVLLSILRTEWDATVKDALRRRLYTAE